MHVRVKVRGMWLSLIASIVLSAPGPANIGTNVHLPPADTLDLAVDLGGKWIRIDMNWDVVQPQQGQWNWTIFDTIIDGAVARGLKVYATLGYTPAWASTGNRRGDHAGNDVPNAAAFRLFVETAVDRYKTKVGAFGTWNEPNLGDFFEGTRQEWIDVVYRPTVQGIRAKCATCVVAGPEVATIGDQYDDFISAALAAEVPTILAAHIYAPFPEDDSQAGFSKDSFYNKLEMRRVIGPFMGSPSIRESAIAAGQGALPIWITEVGKEATMGETAGLENQRKYVERVLDAMETRPWFGGAIFYEMTEEHPGGMWPNVHWGIVLRTADPDATPLNNFATKPAYDYLKMRLAMVPPPPMNGDDMPDAGNVNPENPEAGTDEPPGMNKPAGCGCASGSTSNAWLVLLVALLLRRIPRSSRLRRK